MIPDNRIAVCGPEQGPHLALCADGALWKDEGAGWAPFDFNGLYAGY